MYIFSLITVVSMVFLCCKHCPKALKECDLETIEQFEEKELELKLKEEKEIIEDFEFIYFAKKHD